MSSPFFIVGTQRSGTTLLYQMLNSHPDLFVVNEFWDLYPYVTGERQNLKGLPDLLISHLRLPGSYLDDSEAPPRDPFEHIDSAFSLKLASLGKRRWAIKHPRLTYYLDYFIRRYPDSAFVFIVRDPRAVASSYLKRKMNVANVFYGASLWTQQVRIQDRFRALHPANSHLVRFEDLLADPRAELRRLCDFLGEDYSDALLDYHRKSPETSIHAGNVNIMKPPDRAIAERWRQLLSRRQIGVVDTIARETMQAHGYEPEEGPVAITGVHRMAYGFHQWVMTNYWWQRRSGWWGIRRRVPWLSGSRGPNY